MFDCNPGELTIDALGEAIAEQASEIYAATCRWLSLIAAFEHRKGHEDFGFASCSSWLAWRCAMGERTAREHVRVARDLQRLPRVREQFATGRLSYSKVRALTRAATPDDEAELLEMAVEANAAQLERLLRCYRGVVGADEARRMDRDRLIAWSWQEDGSLSIRGRLPAADGSQFLRALEASSDALRSRDEEAASADALVAMAEVALDSESCGANGAERYQVIVHVDAELLSGEAQEGRCATEDGSPLSVQTAERLACDAGIVPLFEHNGQCLSVGRKTRSVPPHIARAVKARDKTCRFPGCTNKRFIDLHHIEPWAKGGKTSYENLCGLCRFHHHLLHEGGYSVESAADGKLSFRRPDGRPLPAVPKLGRGERRPGTSRPAPRHDSDQPAPPLQGSGDRLDLHYAIDVLMMQPGPRSRSREPG